MTERYVSADAGGTFRFTEAKLSELYQEVILDHNKRPRHFEKIEDATASSHGKNPLCGDDYYLYLIKDADGVLKKVGFIGQGCAISKSSASIMMTLIKGKTATEAEKLKDSFIHFLTGPSVSDGLRTEVGKLKIFEGVRQFPVRVKCAALIWRTLEDALKNNGAHEVSTENEDNNIS